MGHVVDPSVGSGYVKLQYYIQSIPVNLESFESEFGGSIRFDFVLGEITNTEETILEPSLFSVYPNPTEGNASVELKGFTGETVHIQVVDLTGKVLTTRTIDQSPEHLIEEIDLLPLPAGMYFVKVQHAQKSWVRSIVKQ